MTQLTVESLIAYVKCKKLKWREVVIEYGKLKSNDGFTADEMARVFGVAHNTVAPRITDLIHEGRVVKIGAHRETRAGSPAHVHRLLTDDEYQRAQEARKNGGQFQLL